MPIDWKKTDSENFSDLLAKGFADRNMEYLPGGLVLKKPTFVEDPLGTSQIQVIGIPFQNVFGSTKFRYFRVKLSEFERIYRQLLGSETSPIRMRFKPTDQGVLEDTKTVLSKRLSILPQRFILELSEKKQKDPDNPDSIQYVFKFYFSIPETDYQDKTHGLSIINDKDVFIYVEKPNIIVENGRGIIPIDDKLESHQSHTTALIGQSFSNFSSLIPTEYKLENVAIGEDFGIEPVNQILWKSPGGKLTGNIPQRLKDDLLKMSITGDSSYTRDTVESRFKIDNPPTMTIESVFGGTFRGSLGDQVPEYSGPNAIDTIRGYNTSSLSIAFSMVSKEPETKRLVLSDDMTATAQNTLSHVGFRFTSKEYRGAEMGASDTMFSTLSKVGSFAGIKIKTGE